jgi:hypothetical protein
MIKYTQLFEEFKSGKNYSVEEFDKLCQKVSAGEDHVKLSDRYMVIAKPKSDTLIEMFGTVENTVSALREYGRTDAGSVAVDEMLVALCVINNKLDILSDEFGVVNDEDVMFNVLLSNGDVLIDSRKIGFDDETNKE